MNFSDTDQFHRARPAVTTIIPVRNGEKFIGAALESLRAELGPRDEIVVVDDGSTDASAEIARNFSGPLRVFQEVCGGAGAARNRGIKETMTPWITFLDADDLAYPDRIFRLGHRLLADDQPEIAYGGQRRFFDNLPMMAEVDEPSAVLPATMLLKKTVFDRVGVFDPQLRLGEIFPWFAQVLRLKIRIAELPGPVIRRRQHENNISGATDYRAACLRAMRAALAVRRA